MAEGETYPVRLVNSNDQTTEGTMLVFTDENDQPSGDQVPFHVASGTVVVITNADNETVFAFNADNGHLLVGAMTDYQGLSIIGVQSLTATGQLLAGDLSLIGLTGAVSATRYVGGTATVAPTTGDFLAGDFVIALNGTIWICTVSGTPGTWVQANSDTFAPKADPTFTGHVTIPQASAVLDAAALNQVTSALTITSGTLPNLGAWVSGTSKVNPVTRQITAYIECAFDGTANAASVVIAVSPDDSTFTTVGTPSVDAAVNTVGAITVVVPVTIPAGWHIKLTIATHASVSASIYY